MHTLEGVGLIVRRLAGTLSGRQHLSIPMPISLPKSPYQRLRFTVVMLLVGMICVPVLIAGLALFWGARGSITSEVEIRLTTLATDQAARLRDWVGEREFDLAAVGHLASINHWVKRADAGDGPAVDSLADVLDRVRGVFGGRYRSIAVFANSGEWRAPSTFSSIPDHDGLTAIQTGQTFVATHRLSPDTTRAELPIYAPVVDRDGTRRAFILGVVSPGPMYQLLDDGLAGEKLRVFLFDSTGLALNCVEQGARIRWPGSLGVHQNNGNLAGILRYRNARDAVMLGAYQRLPSLGWTILVEQDSDEVFAGLNRLRRVFWFVMGIILLIAVGAATTLASVAVQKLEKREIALRTTSEQLITADRLASVGMMAASVAHEINNPLTTIKVLIHSLREQTPPHDVRNGDLGIVAAEIDKIKALVLRFLQFARPREPEFSLVRLDETLSRIASLMRPQVQIQGVQLSEQYDPHAGTVWADSDQIGQVFVNILLNAVEATPRGGEIRMTTAPDGDDGVTVTIWNSGPGLPNELKERIFEPFFSTKATGTGLGLSIASIIVDKHQGTIRAEGHEDKGTSFIITLHGRRKEEAHVSRAHR